MFQTKPIPKRDVSWRIGSGIALLLMFFAAAGTPLCQMSTSEESAPIPPQELRGKGVFEQRCATCHGLDGLGGEHAPDIVRRSEVSKLSAQDLLNLIHDGIPQRGMPAFSDLSNHDRQGLVAYLRLLQGKSQTNSHGNSAGTSMPADSTRGRDLFFGKAGCSACHQIAGRGQFIAGDLSEFARDHPAGEVRGAILRPAASQWESATALARDGRKFSGRIRNEDNASLQLQDGDGRFYLLMKSSLASVQRKTGEPMPDDYGQRLNPTEIDDLVDYIRREAGAGDVSSSPSGKDRTNDNDEGSHIQD
jgi:cytochrome c oxidase cbb3-type subunit 3